MTAASSSIVVVVALLVACSWRRRSRSSASTSAASSSGSGGCFPEPKGPGLVHPDPDRRPGDQGRPAHDHADDPAAGGDHEGQRAGPRERGRLLPDRRPEGGDRPGRELHGRDLADRADDAALGARPARARRAALRAREDQHDPAGDHRRGDRALGHQGLDRRGQGRRDPGRHAAGDGPAGRGRARAAREDHQRRGRVPGRRAAQGRRARDRRPPDRAPAPLPADAARDRLRPTRRRSSSRLRSS